MKQIISPTVFHQEFGSNTDEYYKKEQELTEECDRDKTRD